MMFMLRFYSLVSFLGDRGTPDEFGALWFELSPKW